ncbi:MAG TPA: protease pro-enzyme activation domain-containing protein [Ktedonobacteraceae bacterium]
MSVQSPQPGRGPQEKRRWITRASVMLPLLCCVIFSTLIGARLIGNAAGASADTFAPIQGQVPALAGKSTLLAPTDSSQNLSLAVGLKLRNAANLKAYIDDTSRPHSIHAHQHLTQGQIAAAYAPLASSQQAVISYLQSYGFQLTSSGKLHLVIGFEGTVGEAEQALHLQINTYRAPDGTHFYAPATNPSVPLTLARVIQNIAGLDNATHFLHPPLPKRPASAPHVSANAVSCLTAGSGQPFLPGQIASAYNLKAFSDAGLQGAGQAVALVEFDDYSSSDISTFTHCYGGSSVPIHRIPVAGGVAQAGPGAFEDELDMELILSAAPRLAALDVYEAPNSSAGSAAIWSQIIEKDAVPVISTSWGECEAAMAQADIQQENALFTLAAAQGQTIFASSGDSGTQAACSANTFVHGVSDPSSQPYVTGAGGTALTLQNDTTYNAETSWNDSSGATGGGLSNLWPMPTWQQGPGVVNPNSSPTPCGAGSGYCREVPDVALNADPATGYLIYCTIASACSGGSWWYGGGTSASAPLWAAFMALTNEKTLHDGGFNIGFLNAYLYQIGQNIGGTSYTSDFHDITTNGANGSTGIYSATASYDMATGLGSYNAWNLANDLEHLANAKTGSRGAAASKTWYFAEGAVGGSYKEYLTVLNPSTTPANVSVTYFFPAGKAPVTLTHSVAPAVRFTISVNTDLGVTPSASLQTHATSIAADVPVVVERPLYFKAHAVASGSDVLGATSTAQTFYFAAGDSRQTSAATSLEMLSLLNPGSTTAHVNVTYYAGGQIVESDSLLVAAQTRRSSSPAKFHGLAAIRVDSDQPVVVERTEYFSGNVPNAGGATTGGATTMGATAQNTDWLFAEGYTGHDFQENLVLGNVTTSAASVTIKLEYTSGTVQTVQQIVNAESQLIFDVNNANAHPNCGANGNPPCKISNSVSIEVSSSVPIVAERVQYFHFTLNGGLLQPGIDDVLGQPGPASQSIYSFAEGQTGSNFNDWLTLQNPNNAAVVVAMTIFAASTIIQKEVTLPAHSRSSFLINDIVNPIASAYPGPTGNTVSLDVQSFGGPVVAERPLYFVFSGTTGASDIFGYTGN